MIASILHASELKVNDLVSYISYQ